MDDSTQVGMNKTGMQMRPVHAKRLMETVSTGKKDVVPDGEALTELRVLYIEQSDSVGSIPAPVSAKGAIKSGAQLLSGRRPQVFIDKLAERLAFERAGTRLYDALIAKFTAHEEELEGVTAEDLLTIRNEEARHFQLVKECLETLGADPTAQTPSADMVGVETAGFMQTVCDPRTSLAHSLHAALSAELIDNAGWEMLITLAREMGQKEMVQQFTDALENEEEHLAKVSGWYETLMSQQGTLGAD